MSVKLSCVLQTACVFLLVVYRAAFGQELACGGLQNHYGPYDYRSVSASQRAIVEGPHFPPKVENLRGGNTSITPGGDIAYTLRVFPNHHRALMAMMKLSQREKTDRPRDSTYTMECWLERGERFRPDDAMVKALFGIYLTDKGRKHEAVEKLDAAISLGVLSPNTDYNIGLAYFNLGEYDKALGSAHRAYSAGFSLPGLRDKLKRVGKWQEPSVVKQEEKESQ